MAILVSFTHAQQPEGTIIYERTIKLQIQIANEDPELQNLMPKERKDRFECLFGGNKAIYRSADDDPQSGEHRLRKAGRERVGLANHERGSGRGDASAQIAPASDSGANCVD